MFGLEDQKKKKPVEEFIFDLEKEIKDSKKEKEIRQQVEKQIQKIKVILRSGDNQEEFEDFGLLLQGYDAILKVISRVVTKKGK